MPPPMPPTLLAKSGKPVIPLVDHSLDTEHAAVKIFRLDGRWGQSWCRFFGILESLRQLFLLHLRIAALFHDIGKANEHFLGAVLHTRSQLQTLRHEHISALVLHLPEVRRWLATNPDLDLEVITAAVLSHHFKASSDPGDWKWAQPRREQELNLYLQHPEVTAILQRVAVVAGLQGPIPTLPTTPWSTSAPWDTVIKEGRIAAREFGRDIQKNKARRSLLLATKAGLVIADSASSGLVRESKVMDTWITDVVHSPPLGTHDISRDIINPRIAQISRKSPFNWQGFQVDASQQGPRVLLLAGCGTGKTLAGWRWAEEQARTRPIGRVVFLYPTRGTATEGFRDYVGWAPEQDGALVHGTSRYELAEMRANPSEATLGKDHEPSEEEARLFALGIWSRKYFSATVDQFLSFMEHSYDSTCLLPVLADAAVIIDEVHSFDQQMFKNLVAFLEAFDVPVLCMTATLPPDRRDRLVAAGLRLYPPPGGAGDPYGLDAREGHPRYSLIRLSSEAQAKARALAAYRDGKRVLWVVNRVSRCQALARELRQELQSTVLCYHSRYRLVDRQSVHARTVAEFKQNTHAVLAVTTQVCEMSLDTTYVDVVITEDAPVTSLVQRFGRGNRASDAHTAHPNDRAILYTYPPEKSLPYSQRDIVAGQGFLAHLESLGRDLSQRDLAEALKKYAPGGVQPDGSARFLDGGYYATKGSLRGEDQFSQPCFLEGDLPAAEALFRAHKPGLDGLTVPVPRKEVLHNPRPPWLPSWIGVASSARYDVDLGFLVDDGGTP